MTRYLYSAADNTAIAYFDRDDKYLYSATDNSYIGYRYQQYIYRKDNSAWGYIHRNYFYDSATGATEGYFHPQFEDDVEGGPAIPPA